MFVLNKLVGGDVSILLLESDAENDEMINRSGQPNDTSNDRTCVESIYRTFRKQKH
jgi:hypothetical protein